MPAPTLRSARKLDIARVTAVRFSASTNQAGLGITPGLPKSLDGDSGSALKTAIESNGFDCSSVDLLSAATLSAFGHNPAQNQRRLVVQQTGPVMCAWYSAEILLVLGVGEREAATGFGFEIVAGDLTGASQGRAGEVFEQVAGTVSLEGRLAAPQIVSATMDATGAQVQVQFDASAFTDVWTSSTGVVASDGPCSSLFLAAVTNQLTAVQGTTRTTNAWCVFRDSKTLTILLGTGAQLTPQIPFVSTATCPASSSGARQAYELVTRGGVLRPSRYSIVSNMQACSIVAPPTGSAVAPTAVVTGPSVLGPCDSGVLSGKSSQGGLGRPLTYSWSLIAVAGAGITSAQVAATQSSFANLQTTASTLTLPVGMPPEGATMEVELSVANFLSQQVSRARVSVRRSANPVPKVEIPGGSRITTNRKIVTNLRVRVSASQCSSGKVQQTSVAWSVVGASTSAVGLAAPYIPTAAEISRYRAANGYLLAIPAGTLTVGYTYTFQASVSQQTSGGPAVAGSSATVAVVVQPLGLLASIANSRRTQDAGAVARLSALASSADLDASNRPLSYQWLCRNTSQVQPTVQLADAYSNADGPCVDMRTGLALDLSSDAALPRVSLPAGLRSNSSQGTARGPVLDIPAGALMPG